MSYQYNDRQKDERAVSASSLVGKYNFDEWAAYRLAEKIRNAGLDLSWVVEADLVTADIALKVNPHLYKLIHEVEHEDGVKPDENDIWWAVCHVGHENYVHIGSNYIGRQWSSKYNCYTSSGWSTEWFGYILGRA
jgi:hypothetical protein